MTTIRTSNRLLKVADLLEAAAQHVEAIRPTMDVDIPQTDWDPPVDEFDIKDISHIEEKKRGHVTPQSLGIVDNRQQQSVEVGKANILAVFDEADENERDFWSNWYVNAHEDLQKLARKYMVPFPFVAGIAAISSPGNNWPMNLKATERVLRLASTLLHDPERLRIEDEMKELRQLSAKPKKDQPPDLAEKLKANKEAWSQLLKSQSLKINTYPDNVRKGLNVLFHETLFPWVSGPKVTPFLKAFLNPRAIDEHMVLDGHAINIWLGVKRPLSEVEQPSKALRAKMIQAYDEAAAERSTTTRAVQAVTWYIWKMVTGESVMSDEEVKQAA